MNATTVKMQNLTFLQLFHISCSEHKSKKISACFHHIMTGIKTAFKARYNLSMLPVKELIILWFKQTSKPTCLKLDCFHYLFSQNQFLFCTWCRCICTHLHAPGTQLFPSKEIIIFKWTHFALFCNKTKHIFVITLLEQSISQNYTWKPKQFQLATLSTGTVNRAQKT